VSETKWRLGHDHIVHASWCPKAEGLDEYKAIKLITDENGRPAQALIETCADMVVHVQQADLKDNHYSPTILTVCDCVVKGQ